MLMFLKAHYSHENEATAGRGATAAHLTSRRRSATLAAECRSASKRSIADQSLFPLVHQDVGDGGCARGPQLAACRVIPGRQLLAFFPARRGSHQRPQLLRSFLEVMLHSHRFILIELNRSPGAKCDRNKRPPPPH